MRVVIGASLFFVVKSCMLVRASPHRVYKETKRPPTQRCKSEMVERSPRLSAESIHNQSPVNGPLLSSPKLPALSSCLSAGPLQRVLPTQHSGKPRDTHTCLAQAECLLLLLIYGLFVDGLREFYFVESE